MAYDAWVHLETAGLQMPKDPENKVSQLAVFRVLSNFVCHAKEPDLLGWVGSRTQEKECDMARSSVMLARQLLVKTGWIIKTGVKHRAGADEYKVVLPGYEPSSGMSKQTTNEMSSGIPSGVSSGVSSGIPSGVSSGLPSGVFSKAKTEQNLNEKDINTTTTEMLFDKVLDVELQAIPTQVPKHALKKKKSATYLPVIENVLKRCPNGAQDRNVAVWVLSLVYPNNDQFRLSSATWSAIETNYPLPLNVNDVVNGLANGFTRSDLLVCEEPF
jgi:hypothetical protein